MADTVDSKSAVARRVGSSPTIRIYYLSTLYMGCAFIFLYSQTPRYTLRQTNCYKNLKTHF